MKYLILLSLLIIPIVGYAYADSGPTITINSPTINQVFIKNKTDVDFIWSATAITYSGNGINVKTFVDGGILASCGDGTVTQSPPFQCTNSGEEILKLSPGTHIFQVIANDSLGNTSTQQVTFQVSAN